MSNINITLNLFLLILHFFFLANFVKSKLIIRLFVLIYSLILNIQLISVYLIDKWIGHEFIINIEEKLILGFISNFTNLIIFFAISTILTCILIFKTNKWVQENYIFDKKFSFFAILLISFFLTQKGMFYELNIFHKIQKNSILEIDEFLPSTFIKKENINAINGKNIIFISVESLEKNFLNANYADITPGINSIIKENNFYSVKQNAAGWTSGSLYTLMTSLKPIYPYKDNENYWFQNITDFNIPSLGHVLNKAKYQMYYFISDPDYSGMRNIIESNHFKVISNLPNENDGYFKTSHDLDLFSELKYKLKNIDKSKPFAIFLSTINTHFPNGIYDKRMEQNLKKNINSFEREIDYSIAAIDYLIYDLYEYLKSNKILDNTIFYIVPDHLIMGSGAHVNKLKELGDRNLYLITNSKYKPQNNLKQTDLPRFIVDASEIKTNVKFLNEYGYSNFEKSYLSKINQSIVERKLYKSTDLNISISKNRLNEIYLNIDNNLNQLDQIKINENTKWVKIFFNSDFNKIYTTVGSNEINYHVDKKFSNPYQLIIFIKKGKLERIYLKNNLFKFIDEKIETDSYVLTENKIKKIIDNNIIDNLIFTINVWYKNLFINKIINNNLMMVFREERDRIIAHAGGSISSKIYTNSLEALDINYNKGIKIFELDIIKTSDNFFVAAHDWDHWKKITNFTGNIPPTKKEFLDQKIFNKYTPLDIGLINQWFSNHQDAYLITDKINLPIEFSNEFYDKDKLMMELFTVDAVKEGISINIHEVVAHVSLWDKLKEDKDLLNSIKFFSSSINYDEKILRQINKRNFKLLGYHLDNKKNEIWSICNKSNLFYGFYMDNFDFLINDYQCN